MSVACLRSQNFTVSVSVACLRFQNFTLSVSVACLQTRCRQRLSADKLVCVRLTLVYSMKLISTSCQLPWQQHWLTEEFRSWTSSKRSPGRSWGGQTFGVWIHWLSIRFWTSLEWHPLNNPRPYYVSSIYLEIKDDHWSPISWHALMQWTDKKDISLFYCVIRSAHRSGSHIKIFFNGRSRFFIGI